MKRLEGRVAIITGAGAGSIGAATAEQFIREGAKVVLGDIDIDGAEKVASRLREAGGDIVAHRLDLGEEKDIVALIDATVERHGGFDILFNNAWDTRPSLMVKDAALESMDVAMWDHVMNVCLRGTMLMIKHAIPHLARSGKAAIINTSSGAGLLGDLYIPAYGTAKAAVNTLSQYVATQYGKLGIRCNSVVPGMVITDTAEIAQAQFLELYERHHLTPHLGAPEDIAAMVTLLASDEGRFVTGQAVVVDGGISAHFAHVADKREAFEQGLASRRTAPVQDWAIPKASVLANRWQKIMASRNARALAAILADDAVIWTNADKQACSLADYVSGKDARGLFHPDSGVSDFRVMYKPDGFVAMATMERRTPGGPVATPFCVVADIASNRITRLEEYFDAATLQ